MGHSAGLRAGTRYAFSRKFKQKGMIKLSTYLREYRYAKEKRERVSKKKFPRGPLFDMGTSERFMRKKERKKEKKKI